MAPRKKKPRKREEKFNQSKEVRAIARERVGIVKPSQAIRPKTDRKKPKYKKSLTEE